MNKATLVIRLLLGLILLVFGLNKFLQFLPPPEATGAAATYLGGLMASGFTFPAIAIVEILVGVACLTNRFVPLALILMAPISVNILLYHMMLDFVGLPLGAALFAFNLILLFANKKSYETILRA